MKRVSLDCAVPRRPRVLSRWGGLSDGRLLIVTLVFLLAWAPFVRAQDIRNPAEDLPGSYNRALASLQRGDYDRGLDVVRNVISYWGAKAGSTVGPIFGHFYYLQGLLLPKNRANPMRRPYEVVTRIMLNPVANVDGCLLYTSPSPRDS